MTYEEIKDRLQFSKPKKSEASAFPELKNIVYKPQPCDGCGKTINKCRSVTYKKLQHPYENWKEKCMLCNKVRNPETGCFEFTDLQYRAFLNDQDTDND